MKQWEYKFDNLYDHRTIEISPDKPIDKNRWYEETIKHLNDLGAQGWEVVAILSPPHYSEGTILLKRETLQRG